MKHIISGYKKKIKKKNKILEKNWNERFILDKIPQYDAYKDVNYLSLGLVKSKIKYEEKQSKGSHKKPKKLRTTSSRLTLNVKGKKGIISPLLAALNDKETKDLFTIKYHKRPFTIKRKKIKLNKTFNFNEKKSEKSSDYIEYCKTYSNKINAKLTNNNEEEKNDKNNIIIDEVLQGELNEIKELWDNLGVTIEYKIFFGEMINKLKNRDIIKNYLLYEKNQLIQFKSDLEKLMNDI